MVTEEVYKMILDIAKYFVWNNELAEDIAQDAALSLFRWPPKEKIDNLRNFLIGVVKKVIALNYRASDKTIFCSLDSIIETSSDNPESTVSFKQTLVHVLNSLMGWEWAIIYFGPKFMNYSERSGAVRQTQARKHLMTLLNRPMIFEYDSREE